MEKKKFELKVRKTNEYVEYDGKKEYIEVVDMKCIKCGYEEEMDADIVFECWEFSDDPFPVFDCPKCNDGMMIPKQIIDETEANEEKKKHLGRPKKKRN